MKKAIYLILSLAVILLVNACSSVKVLDSWKADNVTNMDDNNFIVIARTDNMQARVAFEEEIANQLKERGMKATESFKKFPELKPNVKITDEKKEVIRNLLKSEGYDAVVLSVIKDVQEISKTDTDGGYNTGGYNTGGYYYSYYPRYYGGFHRYYHNSYSYSSHGNYAPSSSTTTTERTYILETVIYNLAATDDQQLVAVVTSKIVDPENVAKTAKDYVKAITKSFD